jgi:rhodanese-related sulfurtransferase/catechol 2,3-dioxygenase-like lactoylglutathione lyase family enzyme
MEYPTTGEHIMSRFQLSLNVDDVEEAVSFYSRLFGVEPAKHRPGYANFVVADPPMKLIVIEHEGEPGTINHLGIEHENGEAVARETARIGALDLPVHVDDPHTCCFATQEKAWTRDPSEVLWEIYTITEDTSHFGASPHGGTPIEHLMPSVDLDAFADAVVDPTVRVIDAQGPGGFETAHVPGSINMGLDDVPGQVERLGLRHDDTLVLYCSDADCLGSEFVGTQLVEAGFTDVQRFPGGIEEWRAAGRPVGSGGA